MKLRYGVGDWRPSEHEPFARARYIVTTYLLNRGGHMADWSARLRATWHAGFCLYDGEICLDCGRPVVRGIGTYWHAPDDLWMRINGGFAGVKCPVCFADQCAADGIHIHWLATSEEGAGV